MNDANLRFDDEAYLWDRSGTPDPLVMELEQTLSPLAFRGRLPVVAKRPINWRILRAAAMVALLALAAAWLTSRPAPTAWQVTALRGQPQIGSSVSHDRVLNVGQWLQTDDASQARLAVADIGSVTVEPNSRLRLLASGPTAPNGPPEHRLELAHGAISAVINAPPRLFFVNTRAAVAVDYGCAYSLTAEHDGSGLLCVEQGLVMLEGHGRSALVPMNAKCHMREGFGPGTPFSDHANAALQAALDRLDFSNGAEADLSVALAESSMMDTVTLWHLLERTSGEDRAQVADRLMSFVPLPEGVSLADVLNGHAAAIAQWRVAVEAHW